MKVLHDWIWPFIDFNMICVYLSVNVQEKGEDIGVLNIFMLMLKSVSLLILFCIWQLSRKIKLLPTFSFFQRPFQRNIGAMIGVCNLEVLYLDIFTHSHKIIPVAFERTAQMAFYIWKLIWSFTNWNIPNLMGPQHPILIWEYHTFLLYILFYLTIWFIIYPPFPS